MASDGGFGRPLSCKADYFLPDRVRGWFIPCIFPRPWPWPTFPLPLQHHFPLELSDASQYGSTSAFRWACLYPSRGSEPARQHPSFQGLDDSHKVGDGSGRPIKLGDHENIILPYELQRRSSCRRIPTEEICSRRIFWHLTPSSSLDWDLKPAV